MCSLSKKLRWNSLRVLLWAGVTALTVTVAMPVMADDEDHADKDSHAEDQAEDDHDEHGQDDDSDDRKEDDDKADEDDGDDAEDDADHESDDDDDGEDDDDDEDRFSYDDLKDKAESLSEDEYEEDDQAPEFLRDLSPGELAQIQYQKDKALWRDDELPFRAMFYHQGSYYDHPVKIHVIDDDGKTESIDFDKDNFDYPDDDLKDKVDDDQGYAGVKLLRGLDKDKMDEVMSFLGASYFRALGAASHYGLSARGLAVNTGNTDEGEEFPRFTEFWLKEPDKDSDKLTVYALLDSPSVTGAYQFKVKPDKATVTHVEQTLYTRKDIDKLGIAPLTSMFTWGENSLPRMDDYRPEAHDSDGLLVTTAEDEWLWRPLTNPHSLWMNQYDADHVRGFGLLQRDRDFDHYQDLDFEYEDRPNAWVTPDGDWGKGELELVEIPSGSEANDNITLYWIPEDKVKADEELHFAYDIKWSDEEPVPDSLARTTATRIGMEPTHPEGDKNRVRVAVDFEGGDLEDMDDDDTVEAELDSEHDVDFKDAKAIPNPHTGGWRLTFLIPTDDLDEPQELRAHLEDSDGDRLTETWNYLLAKP